MTSILSSVSSLFGKALVLGTLLPVTVFIPIGALLFQNALGGSSMEMIRKFDGGWQLLAFPFLAIVASGMLHNLNVPLTRLYEGYPWRASSLGRWRIARHEDEFDELNARWSGLRTLSYFLRRASSVRLPDASKSAIQAYQTAIGQRVKNTLPSVRSSVLPTRLGNTIRSFESYPRVQYNMSAIPLWPRLTAKIDAGHAQIVENAKISFDFALNCSFLSALLALSLLVVGVAHPSVPFSLTSKASLLCIIGALLFLAYLFYLMMIERALAWGETVKAAFDLYRRQLLVQLGYEAPPKTLGEERDLWHEISQRVLFGASPRVRQTEFVSGLTVARGEPADARLEVSRSLAADAHGTFVVTLAVTNSSEPAKTVENVVVSDKLHERHGYVSDSASSPVKGANPYLFDLGQLAPEETKIVKYRILSIDGKGP